DGGESERVVRRMITAASEAIGTRHRPHTMRRHVAPAPALDEARERARRGVLGALRVDPNRRAVDDPVAALVVADDVVVEDRFDRNLFGDRPLGMTASADEALLL